MSQLQQNCNAILNALDEGKFIGAITVIEDLHSDWSQEQIVNYIRCVFENDPNLEYWLEQYQNVKE